jgi:hypothetical protein
MKNKLSDEQLEQIASSAHAKGRKILNNYHGHAIRDWDSIDPNCKKVFKISIAHAIKLASKL